MTAPREPLTGLYFCWNNVYRMYFCNYIVYINNNKKTLSQCNLDLETLLIHRFGNIGRFELENRMTWRRIYFCWNNVYITITMASNESIECCYSYLEILLTHRSGDIVWFELENCMTWRWWYFCWNNVYITINMASNDGVDQNLTPLEIVLENL